MQLFTLYQTDNLKYLRDHYFNLAIKSFNFCYPSSCKVFINESINKLIPKMVTLWDYIELNETMTIDQFINFIKENYQIDVLSITINNQELFISNENNNSNNTKNLFMKKIDDIYFESLDKKTNYNKKYCFIKIDAELNNLKIKMPLFKYNLK